MLIAAFAGALAIVVALWQLAVATTGIDVTQSAVSGISVTRFAPTAGARAPVVVIAHGFAGSQQLMQSFAVTLARNGYVVLTFDFPGHGRNAAPLPGGLVDHDARTRALLGALDTVVAHGRTLPQGDGRVALLGHSMASEIVVEHAQQHPEVGATIAVSLFSPEGTVRGTRNLLVIDGALEPSMLIDQGLHMIGERAGVPAREGVTYGRFADGSARRLALAAGVEHIGVLYSHDSMAEALAWLDAAFARHGSGYLDARGPWLLMLYAGLIALAWPLSLLLPRVAPAPLGAGCRGRRLLLIATLPALLTPLLLWKVPSDFLPLLLGDYLLLHFGLYGFLTAAGMFVAGVRLPPAGAARGAAWKFPLAVVLAAGYAVLVLGAPLDRWVTSFAPSAGRMALILALLAGTMPYFIADEWLTRGAAAPRGAYVLTKCLFLLSLASAIVLNLPQLFFLVIIVPAILLLFIVYGLLSHWSYRRTLHPLVGALANALAFAWAIAVTFPLVSR